MKTFKQYLGPEATKRQDKEEISRQKKHLSNQAKEYYDQAEREGTNGGAAKAKGDSFLAAKNNIHEDGAAGGVGGSSVAGIAGSGDSRVPSTQREPGVSKKRNPVLKNMFRRNPPKM